MTINNPYYGSVPQTAYRWGYADGLAQHKPMVKDQLKAAEALADAVWGLVSAGTDDDDAHMALAAPLAAWEEAQP